MATQLKNTTPRPRPCCNCCKPSFTRVTPVVPVEEFRILEYGDFRLLENGDKRLLE